MHRPTHRIGLLVTASVVLLTGCSSTDNRTPTKTAEPTATESHQGGEVSTKAVTEDRPAEGTTKTPPDVVAKITPAVASEWAAAYADTDTTRTHLVNQEVTGHCVAEEHSWWAMSGLDGLPAGEKAPDLIEFGVYDNDVDRHVACSPLDAVVVIDINTGVILKGADVVTSHVPTLRH